MIYPAGRSASVDVKSSADASSEGSGVHQNLIITHHPTKERERAGVVSIRSESSEISPRSNFNAELTPSSVNYSADEYGQGAHLSTSGVPHGASAAGGTQVRKLGSTHGGFKASAPFLTSFGPQSTDNSGAVFSKPSPIKIPSNGYLSSASIMASPVALDNHASQEHMPHLATNMTNNITRQVQSLDFSFVSLFSEAKQEILKLLRDDKFPRFKLTQEFNQFISAVKTIPTRCDARRE